MPVLKGLKNVLLDYKIRENITLHLSSIQVYERRKPQHLSVCISRKFTTIHDRTRQDRTEQDKIFHLCRVTSVANTYYTKK